MSDFNWFLPDKIGSLKLFFLILAGILAGRAVLIGMEKLLFHGGDEELPFMIGYILTFIPAFIYAKAKGAGNKIFGDEGFKIDNNNFSAKTNSILFLFALCAVLSLSVILDPINKILPPMPEIIKNTFRQILQKNIFLNFMTVGIIAPLFEEFLCRGLVLRGLLFCKKKHSPTSAILISSLFFAAIHLNPWQGIPAFTMGCLFGYVYYKTGSLKLPIFMHFANNTVSMILYNIDRFKDADSLYDCIPGNVYFCVYAISAILLIACCRAFIKLKTDGGDTFAKTIFTDNVIE